jgi:hypothetical protein
MDTNRTPSGPAPAFQSALIWAALLMSQGMVVIISQTAVTKPLSAPDQPPASSIGAIDPKIFMVIAGVLLISAFLIPRLLFAAARKRLQDPSRARSAPAPGALSTAFGELSMQEIMQSVFVVWIVRWALLESITMIGFVSSMLSAQPVVIYPFAAVSFIGFALTFPTEEKIRASARE